MSSTPQDRRRVSVWFFSVRGVAFIEAKASAPKEVASSAFMDEIKRKFADSLRLFNEIKNKQHGDGAFNRLPIRLRELSIDPQSYLICLIVHGHQLGWLVGLQDAFRDAMREVVTEWNIQDSNVRVYNEETALESKLIVAYIPKKNATLSVRPTQRAICRVKKQKSGSTCTTPTCNLVHYTSNFYRQTAH